MSMKDWFKDTSPWRSEPMSREQREKGREIKAKLSAIFARERQRGRAEQLRLPMPIQRR
jgi:hypothetical protein